MSEQNEPDLTVVLKDRHHTRVFIELAVLAKQMRKLMPLNDFFGASFAVLYSLAIRHEKKPELALVIADYFKSAKDESDLQFLQTIEWKSDRVSRMPWEDPNE